MDTNVATNLVGWAKDNTNKTTNAIIKYTLVNLVNYGSKISSNSDSVGFYLFSTKNCKYLTIVSGYTNFINILLDTDLYVNNY